MPTSGNCDGHEGARPWLAAESLSPERSSVARKFCDHGVVLKSPATITGSLSLRAAANAAMPASSALRMRELPGPSGQCKCAPSTVTALPFQSSVTCAASTPGPLVSGSSSAEVIGQRENMTTPCGRGSMNECGYERSPRSRDCETRY